MSDNNTEKSKPNIITPILRSFKKLNKENLMETEYIGEKRGNLFFLTPKDKKTFRYLKYINEIIPENFQAINYSVKEVKNPEEVLKSHRTKPYENKILQLNIPYGEYSGHTIIVLGVKFLDDYYKDLISINNDYIKGMEDGTLDWLTDDLWAHEHTSSHPMKLSQILEEPIDANICEIVEALSILNINTIMCCEGNGSQKNIKSRLPETLKYRHGIPIVIREGEHQENSSIDFPPISTIDDYDQAYIVMESNDMVEILLDELDKNFDMVTVERFQEPCGCVFASTNSDEQLGVIYPTGQDEPTVLLIGLKIPLEQILQEINSYINSHVPQEELIANII